MKNTTRRGLAARHSRLQWF